MSSVETFWAAAIAREFADIFAYRPQIGGPVRFSDGRRRHYQRPTWNGQTCYTLAWTMVHVKPGCRCPR